MIEDSFKFAADDVNARKLIEARLDAGALITTTEKSLGEGSHLIAQAEAENDSKCLVLTGHGEGWERPEGHSRTHG